MVFIKVYTNYTDEIKVNLMSAGREVIGLDPGYDQFNDWGC